MKSSRYLNLVAAVFALVHLSTGLTFSTVDPPDTPSYVNFARTLADQFTLAADARVDHFRTPGYPLFMRGVWALLGERRSAVLAETTSRESTGAHGQGAVVVTQRSPNPQSANEIGFVPRMATT